MGLRALRHGARWEETRHGGDFPARGQGDEGHAARAGED